MIRASTLVKTAALAMVGTSLLIFPAAAQQMATVAPAPNFAACDKMKDSESAGATQCYLDTLKSHTAVAERRIQVANGRIAEDDKQFGKQFACMAFIKEKRTAGVVLDPTRMNREKGCAYAIELGCLNCN